LNAKRSGACGCTVHVPGAQGLIGRAVSAGRRRDPVLSVLLSGAGTNPKISYVAPVGARIEVKL
jgi:hypothetical protein